MNKQKHFIVNMLYRYDTIYHPLYKKMNNKYDLDKSIFENNYVKLIKKDVDGFSYEPYFVIGRYDKHTSDWIWGWAMKKEPYIIINTTLLNNAILDDENWYYQIKLLLITHAFKITDLLQIDLIKAIYSYYYKYRILSINDENFIYYVCLTRPFDEKN